MFLRHHHFNIKELIIKSIILGAFAALFMDALGYVSAYLFHTPVSKYFPIGHAIFCLMASPYFINTHTYLSLFIGWGMHFAVGIVDAFIFLIVARLLCHNKPNCLMCLVYAWLMMIMPMLIAQPLMGLGIAGMHSANPIMTEFHTWMFHSFFGIGLFTGFYLLRHLRVYYRQQSLAIPK